MADDRRDKRRSEPVLDFYWDPPELAVDKTYSTTIRIKVLGWWEGGKPRQVGVSFRQKGEQPKDSRLVVVQNSFGVHPLPGLLPGHHYLVVVFTEDHRRQVEKLIPVPEIPKLKKPTDDEKKTDVFKAKAKRLQAEKEFKEAERGLKQVEPPEPKSRLKILHVYRRLSRLEVVLQRIGKDGKPEDGEISVLDFEQAGVVFGDATGDFPFRKKKWGIVVVFLPYFDYPRQVTFFLPDDTDAKVVVDVPLRIVKEEKKPQSVPKPSLFQRMREAYLQERDKGKLPASGFLIQRRRPINFFCLDGG